ncbi:hypothetical protein GLW08_10415 [Pontibacillus yanchengensis]|uniref:Uncharacterized protein n=1 Tax=Pontibacillus yanchengensis TaxID=462910 RepID=A0ACC7VHU0_9BACI|nr:hypothetical protein [Pontibacillus yanchengensis]MYL53749.1 hypothetical protein [Pontibacillus yanchengensis]
MDLESRSIHLKTLPQAEPIHLTDLEWQVLLKVLSYKTSTNYLLLD